VVFRYVLLLPDGEPHDPAALVSMIPNWTVGETFTLADGESVRILAIDTDMNEVLRRRFDGVFMVEPVDE
jgi:hypothetical protein